MGQGAANEVSGTPRGQTCELMLLPVSSWESPPNVPRWSPSNLMASPNSGERSRSFTFYEIGPGAAIMKRIYLVC
jgi:hypothetical protein